MSCSLVGKSAWIVVLLAGWMALGCSPRDTPSKPQREVTQETDPVEEAEDQRPATSAEDQPMAEVPPMVETPAEDPAAPVAGKVVLDRPAGRGLDRFADWPKPEVVLFVSGQQQGYIEPCGCSGLENQKGGLMRRYTLLEQLREDHGWNVVPIDVGNQVRRFGRQPEIKFQTTAEGLRQMDYQAVTFGPQDLRLSVDETFAAVAAEDPEDIRFLSANASLLGLTPTYRIIEAGGKRIGVTGVFGKSHHSSVSNDLVEIADPLPALKQAWSDLEGQNCDFHILLAHASLDESRELAAQVPGFDLVVTAGGAGEPTLELENIEGTGTQMVQVGTKGMYVGVIGLFNDEARPLRYERVALDSSFDDSRAMLDLLASYQSQLETIGLEGLGLRPRPHPSGKHFVGSQACADCHTTAHEIWEGTPHAHALDTLVKPPERYEVPRHHDPECLSCHVTGWDPQGYYPFESGYLDLKKTPLMHGVGCENCHGPGSDHVASQNGEGNFTDEEVEQIKQAMRLPLDQARNHCIQCHDLDNSPDFHEDGAFEKYWKRIEHVGLD
ncbi:MAG: multiheme c-type cytochrome [Pirellulaceae bacterium]